LNARWVAAGGIVDAAIAAVAAAASALTDAFKLFATRITFYLLIP
jgi:hypothetical protein